MCLIDEPTNEDFKELLKKHGKTRQEAADLLYVKLSTVHGYCDPATSTKHRKIPRASWELLLLKLDDHPFQEIRDKVKKPLT
jgi:hypothetical protein